MEGARLKRIMREIASCERDKDDEITVQMIDGPAHSPFESGLFKVDIVVPEGYPFHPLQMRFITKVYHPNVSSQSGAICLDILKDAEVAKHYTSDLASYNKTAEYWTRTYASRDAAPKQGDAALLAGFDPTDVARFTSKGYSESNVITAFKRLGYRGDNAKTITDDKIEELLRQL